MGKVSARKRGMVWEYRFEGPRADGQRQQISKSGFRTKKDALDAGSRAYSEYQRTGSVNQISDIGFSDYIDQWFDLYVRANLRYNTQMYYLSVVENHLKPAFGKYRLAAINAAALQGWANRLKFNGLSRSSITNIMGVMREALNYAVTLQYIQYSPMVFIRTPDSIRPPYERSLVSAEDWDRIIRRFPEGDRYHIMLLIGRYTGLRIAEVCGLTWDNIDLDAGTITVERQLLKRNYGVDVRQALQKKGKKEERSSWYFAPTKTRSSIRTIAIGQTLAEALRREKDRQQKYEEEYGDYYTVNVMEKGKDEKGQDLVRILPCQKAIRPQLERAFLVCIGENGELTSPDSFKYCSRLIHHELQISTFSFHGLRHTMATALAEAGASPKAVQQRLGHSSVDITLNTYTHSTPQMEKETADLLDDLYENRS